MRFITATLLLTFSSAAVAADIEAPEPQVVYKQKTEIDFEGIELTGELVKPQGTLLITRKQASFNPLIKLRSDFDDEMSASVDEVK